MSAPTVTTPSPAREAPEGPTLARAAGTLGPCVAHFEKSATHSPTRDPLEYQAKRKCVAVLDGRPAKNCYTVSLGISGKTRVCSRFSCSRFGLGTVEPNSSKSALFLYFCTFRPVPGLGFVGISTKTPRTRTRTQGVQLGKSPCTRLYFCTFSEA